MKPVKPEYYLDKIDSIETAEEVINSSPMNEDTHNIFSSMLRKVKKYNRESDWQKLRQELAQWLSEQSYGNYSN